uniref:Double zinc ribbon and ankyrin repeat domains 1 n=1 Tax=Fundulus heteroclitus TaxID=8078 RepID=A0A3Q2P0W8_FUNHE
MAAGAISAPFIIPITNLETHKTKNHIDTRTLFSIQSDSAGVRIFFTLDGSKPVEGQRRSGGRSRMYTDPILLPAGRVAVRAVAVTRDGRQSSVVTKIFSVDQAESDTTTEDKEDGLRKVNRDGLFLGHVIITHINTSSTIHWETFAHPLLMVVLVLDSLCSQVSSVFQRPSFRPVCSVLSSLWRCDSPVTCIALIHRTADGSCRRTE